MWLASAIETGRSSPEEAVAILDRGLAHLPGHPDLVGLRLHMLERLGDFPAVRDGARDALAALPLPPVEAALRASLARALLRLSELEEAEDEARRLTAVSAASPALLADTWGRLALGYEFRGRPDRADACLDLSLGRGPAGLAAIQDEVGLQPERLAAARSLARRALARHPGHPDLVLGQAADLMTRDELERAATVLAAAPTPLPARLVPLHDVLEARLAILDGRVDEGLEKLGTVLDRAPAEGPALAVLLETWKTRGRPAPEEMARRLEAAWPHLPPQARPQIEALIDELRSRAEG